MTITVTAKMLEEKDPCDLFEFTDLFGDSIELTVENLKLACKYDLNMLWFFENFPELIKKLNRSEVIKINCTVGVWYALYIDLGPSDDTRNAACEDSYDGYWYVLRVDKCPHDVTRNSVLENPIYVLTYAENIDKGPRDDTRNAVLKDPAETYLYAILIDKCARKDTRKAVLKDPKYAKLYDKYLT